MVHLGSEYQLTKQRFICNNVSDVFAIMSEIVDSNVSDSFVIKSVVCL